MALRRSRFDTRRRGLSHHWQCGHLAIARVSIEALVAARSARVLVRGKRLGSKHRTKGWQERPFRTLSIFMFEDNGEGGFSISSRTNIILRALKFPYGGGIYLVSSIAFVRHFHRFHEAFRFASR